MGRRSARGAVFLACLLVASAIAAVGCTPKAAVKVAMVTDVGGLGDGSFNDGAAAGLKQAEVQLGTTAMVLESKTPADYEPNLTKASAAGCSPVFAVGYLMQDTIRTIAPKYPATVFAGIDESFSSMAPANVVGILFKEQEAGYLAGFLAASVTSDPRVSPAMNKDLKIGFIGGMEIPPVQRYQAGYIQGARAANPKVQVVSEFTGSFTDEQKGRLAAQAMIGQGCDIIFAAAGVDGIGALKACFEKKTCFIGVDVDQFVSVPGYGEVIVTSAVKDVGRSVFTVIKGTLDGTLKGGHDVEYGLREGAVGLAPYHDFDSKIPLRVKQAVDAQKAGIIDGSIAVSEKVPT